MGAGKRYSAGAIFLQVVPVFANVQRAIEDEAKNIDRALGDQMEKSGEKAGTRAGKAAADSMGKELEKGAKDSSTIFEREFRKNIDGINKALGEIDAKRLPNEMRAEFKRLKKEVDELGKTDLFDDRNLERQRAKIEDIVGGVKGLRDNAKITLKDNFDAVERGLRKIVTQVDDLREPIDLEIRTEVAERKMGAWRRSFSKHVQESMKTLEGTTHKTLQRIQRDLDDLHADVTLSPDMVKSEMRKLMAELEHIADTDVTVEGRFEARSAHASLAAFNTAMNRLDGRVARVRVDVNQSRGALGLLSRSSDDAANSFRSFNAVLLASTALGPALIPILGALAGGLLALGPAAAVAVAGLSAVIIGFTGIGDALQAMGQKDDAAAQTAQTAAKAQESSAERVADARRRAADAVESALDRQKDAQEAYADSITDVKDAEQALAEAREAAKNNGKDIQERISDNKLAQDQGLLDVFNATVNFDSVMADGSATNAEKEQARIELEQARDRLADLREEAKELAKEQKKWREEGVNGTDEVKTAQERLNDALDAQKDAYEALRDSAEAVDEARAQGARDVADAMKGQADAMEAISTQQSNLDAAMNKLGPAGQKFALFLYGLRKGFREFRDDIQTVLLPQIQEAISSFLGSSNASVLRKALVGLAAGFGAFAVALSTSFQGEAWGGFFEMLARLGPDIQAAYGNAFISFLEALASILTTLGPFALKFAEGFSIFMDAFAGWAASAEGQQAIQDFLSYVKQIGPEVLDFFGLFAATVAHVLVALAPYGKIVLDLIVALLEYISSIPVDTLSVILGAVLALITASQFAYLTMNLLMAGSALLTSVVGALVFAWVALGIAIFIAWQKGGPLAKTLAVIAGVLLTTITSLIIYTKAIAVIRGLMLGWAAASYGAAGATYAVSTAQKVGAAAARAFAIAQAVVNAVLSANPIALVVIAIIALVVAIVLLWRNNEGFRDFVMKAWEKIQEAFVAAWEVIKVVLAAIGEAFAWLWHNAISPALHWIGDAFSATFRFMRDAWNNVLWPVIKMIGKVIWNLWKVYFKVYLVLIKAAFKATFIAMKWVWEHVLKPALSAIGRVLGWLWKNVFKPTLGWIGDRFSEIFSGMKWVWEHVLKPVFDYIGDKALPKLKGAFQTAVDGIKTLWDGLKKIVGAPIKFVLDTVINNGLIDGFNKVANWVGMDGFEHIPIPKALQSYATGGIMPGYTPGRDPHKFVSPTGGRLELSGGEAVMRPEWTAAMGSGYVNQMNALARSGGVNAIRNAMGMGGYWMGGILPLPGGSFAQHASGYPGFAGDLNWGSGYQDYGKAVKAWKDGIVAQMNYIGDSSYGRWAVLNHADGQNSLYAHLSNFAKMAVGDKVKAGQTVGYVGDLGNTGNPPTSHLHFEINGGAVNYADTATSESRGRSIPGWLMDIVKDPLGAVKGWASKPFDSASDLITNSPIFGYMKKVPLLVAEKVTDKVWDIVPGWVKTAAGWAGDAADFVVGGVKNAAGAVADAGGAVVGGIKDGAGAVGGFLGLANGGILPYNGTMMYDAGGYLPPGLTTVMNLTGKPEPVFTNDQWAEMEGGVGGGNLHYEPHFEGSNLTPADVAADLNFTFRRIRRGGKYEGVGS